MLSRVCEACLLFVYYVHGVCVCCCLLFVVLFYYLSILGGRLVVGVCVVGFLLFELVSLCCGCIVFVSVVVCVLFCFSVLTFLV